MIPKIETEILKNDIKILLKEIDNKDKEIEILNKRVKEINEEMNYQINLKTKNANEINRLNTIINELEKWLEDYHNATGLSEYETGIDDAVCDTIKKLRELKGDSSNDNNGNI